jgi:hypothetical protein
MRSSKLRAIAASAAGVVAIGTTVVALLVLREPISTAALVMNPETGELVASEVSTGFRYPSLGQVTTLALLAACLVGVAVMAWGRRSELVAAARRRLRPDNQGYGALDGDATDLLDNAPVESLD